MSTTTALPPGEKTAPQKARKNRLDAIFRARSVASRRLEETLLRLAQLASEVPAIADIDLNPFVVSADPAGCLAVDARILLAPPRSFGAGRAR